MQDLIARLEKATGPDRELDDEIALIAGCTEIGSRVFRDVDGRYLGSARYYTSSIDAASTLVPQNHWWSLDSEDVDGAGDVIPPGALVARYGDDGPILRNRVTAATPAIAFCIAALKARASLKTAE